MAVQRFYLICPNNIQLLLSAHRTKASDCVELVLEHQNLFAFFKENNE